MSLAGVRTQLQAALSTITSAFAGSDGATRTELQQLLLKRISSESSVVRLVTVTWSMRLFPFDDCLARYVCIVGAADQQREVQTEAQLGLNPTSFSRERSSNAAAAYPTIPQFLQFLREQNAQ